MSNSGGQQAGTSSGISTTGNGISPRQYSNVARRGRGRGISIAPFRRNIGIAVATIATAEKRPSNNAPSGPKGRGPKFICLSNSNGKRILVLEVEVEHIQDCL